jgi:hypothetical protein
MAAIRLRTQDIVGYVDSSPPNSLNQLARLTGHDTIDYYV